MWVSGYLPSTPPSHEEKRDYEEETNILSCAIKWHLYNFCIYPTWKYPSIGLETGIIQTICDQSQTNFAKFCLSMRFKLSKKKKPKENQTTSRVKIQGYYSKLIVSDLVPSGQKDLHRTMSQTPNSLYSRSKESYKSSGAGDSKNIPDAVPDSCRMNPCTLLDFGSISIIVA